MGFEIRERMKKQKRKEETEGIFKRKREWKEAMKGRRNKQKSKGKSEEVRKKEMEDFEFSKMERKKEQEKRVRGSEWREEMLILKRKISRFDSYNGESGMQLFTSLVMSSVASSYTYTSTYTHAYTCRMNHNDKGRAKTSLEKYVPLPLL